MDLSWLSLTKWNSLQTTTKKAAEQAQATRPANGFSPGLFCYTSALALLHDRLWWRSIGQGSTFLPQEAFSQHFITAIEKQIRTMDIPKAWGRQKVGVHFLWALFVAFVILESSWYHHTWLSLRLDCLKIVFLVFSKSGVLGTCCDSKL